MQNKVYNRVYDKYNIQNDTKAIECFLNSLNSKLCKDIMVRIEDNMRFSEVFMIFIKHERLQQGELYDAIEQLPLNVDVGKFQGANIKDMCVEMQKDIKALIKANQFNSKHDAKIYRILTKAGGINNSEYSNPMYALWTNLKCEVLKQMQTNSQQWQKRKWVWKIF